MGGQRVFVGVYGSAHSTRCIVMDSSGQTLSESERGSCEWKLGVSRVKAQQVFLSCVDHALSKAKSSRQDVASVVACLTEAEKPRDKAVIIKWITNGFPNASANVHSSAVAILAAGTQGNLSNSIGLVVEHCVWAVARTELGEEIFIGGNIHDSGNSVSIATRCITNVADAINNNSAKSLLTSSVLAKLGLNTDDSFNAWLEHGLSTDTANDLTSVCFDCERQGDPTAKDILVQTANTLAVVIQTISSLCFPKLVSPQQSDLKASRSRLQHNKASDALTVVLDGLIGSHPRMIELLQAAVPKLVPEVKFVVRSLSPAYGAGVLAISTAGESERKEMDKVIDTANATLPKFASTLSTLEKTIESIEVQSLVTSASIRTEFDRHVVVLERRMNQLIGDLESQKKAQVNKLLQFRKELKTAMADTTERIRLASDIKTTKEFTETRTAIHSHLTSMKPLRQKIIACSSERLAFHIDSQVFQNIKRLGGIKSEHNPAVATEFEAEPASPVISNLSVSHDLSSLDVNGDTSSNSNNNGHGTINGDLQKDLGSVEVGLEPEGVVVAGTTNNNHNVNTSFPTR